MSAFPNGNDSLAQFNLNNMLLQGGEMADRLEPRSFNPGWVPGASGALCPHQKHRERIQNELKDFLSAEEACETANRVYNLTVDVDEEIDKILRDPLARRRYEYDGQFFTPRGTRHFHTAFDGLHLLEWLSDSMLATFFRGREKEFAVRWLIEELGKHAWVAKRRRLNWEESHTLDLVPKEVLEAVFERSGERKREVEAGPPPLSLEERAFFQSYEAQMERHG
jgi:hypothetical protein